MGGHLGRLPPPTPGKPIRMDENTQQDAPDKGITSPDKPTHQATTPPGNQDRDEDAIRKGEEQIDRAGGGH